jgi:hypothetical protein
MSAPLRGFVALERGYGVFYRLYQSSQSKKYAQHNLRNGIGALPLIRVC